MLLSENFKFKNLLFRLFLFMLSFFLISAFLYILFYPVLTTESVMFNFAITPFDIAKTYPKIWELIKKVYFIFFFFSYLIVFNYLYSNFQKYFSVKKTKKDKKIDEEENLSDDSLKILVGKNSAGKDIFLKESGLFQNVLITGTIGSRKNLFCNVSFYKSAYFLQGF